MPDDKPPIPLDNFAFGKTLRGQQKGDRVFDRFMLARLLGRGGMGVVWLAFDERLGREVALKFAPEIVRWDDIAIEELKEETRKGLELAHPNIVKTYDFLLDDALAAISMEFIDGEQLGTLRAKQPQKIFEPHQISHWVAQLLDALEYAHTSGKVIHRDLKPANLMIDSEGNLSITDFGIARSISDAVNRATFGGATTGTLAYMSPQQAEGGHPQISDDIYSIGSTLYELLTGKPPFFSGNIAKQLSEEPAVSLSRRREEFGIINAEPLPAKWEETILACLAKNPLNRPTSAAEVQEFLGLGEATLSPSAARKDVTNIHAPAGPIAANNIRVGGAAKAPALPRERSHLGLWMVLVAFLFIVGGFAFGTWWVYDNLPQGFKEKLVQKQNPPSKEPAPLKPVTPTKLPPDIKPSTSPVVFTTVQAAINNARSGATVTIPDGIYDEQLKFKDGIQLKAENSGKVTIQTDGKTGSTIMIENCKTGSVSGIVFQHTGSDVLERATWPVLLMKSSSVTLQECSVQSGVGDGAWLIGIGKPQVLHCVFRQCAQNGLVLEAGCTGLVENSEARKNGASGIEVRLTGTSAVITGNTCMENGGSGVVVKDGASANLSGKNILKLNGEAGIAAVGAGVSLTVNGATCEDNLIGILTKSGARSQLVECTVRNSNQTGIHFDMPGGGCEVTNCTVEKSTLTGIEAFGASNTAIALTGNKVRISGMSGIAVFAAKGAIFKAMIEHNESTNNGHYGILAAEGASGVIRENTTRDNNLGGVGQQEAASDLLIQGNKSAEAR